MISNLTVIIIARNESANISKAVLNCLDFSKVIVIDHNSSDETVEKASSAGAMVVHSTASDFSEIRTEALKYVETDWIMYIDADEYVTPELKRQVCEVIIDKTYPYAAYSVRRVNNYLGSTWPSEEKIIRLFLRSRLSHWYGAVHESAKVDGKVGILSGKLLHHTHRNLSQMIRKTNEWSTIEAKLRLNASHPPVVSWRLVRVFLTGFIKSYIFEEGYKVGTVGFIESIFQGYSLYITYAKLWEMQLCNKTHEL